MEIDLAVLKGLFVFDLATVAVASDKGRPIAVREINAMQFENGEESVDLDLALFVCDSLVRRSCALGSIAEKYLPVSMFLRSVRSLPLVWLVRILVSSWLAVDSATLGALLAATCEADWLGCTEDINR